MVQGTGPGVYRGLDETGSWDGQTRLGGWNWILEARATLVGLSCANGDECWMPGCLSV
jgi:hypothetical protein